jgi:hypothetical protein
MDDNMRAQRRRLIDTLVRGWMQEHHEEVASHRPTIIRAQWVVLPQAKPLTPAQQLALSVLLGDPAASEEVLVDYLQDTGRYAVVSADAVRKQERERIKSLIASRADDAEGYSLWALYDDI